MIWSIPKLEDLREEDFTRFLNDQHRKKVTRHPGYYALKRLSDLILASIGVLVLSPLMLVIGIIIRVDSKGKALFAHERVGKDGKKFVMFKFRTMRHDARHQEFSPTSAEDERVTAMGKFLRRTSLDELPQLFNVLAGQMSLVGPRPEMEFIVKDYTPLQRARLLVKPGLTGLWQLAGRKDLPLHENIEYDLYYLEHQSLLLDLIIILKTFRVVISGKGAY